MAFGLSQMPHCPLSPLWGEGGRRPGEGFNMRLFFQAGFKLILTVLVLAFLTPQQIQAQGSVYLRLAHQAKPVA